MDTTMDRGGRWEAALKVVIAWTGILTAVAFLYLAWIVLGWSVFGPVAAPAPIGPADGAVLTRAADAQLNLTRLEWAPVPGAMRYVVETQSCDPAGCDVSAAGDEPPTQTIERTAYEFGTLAGPERRRWRVWAVNIVGAESARSEWREYQFK